MTRYRGPNRRLITEQPGTCERHGCCLVSPVLGNGPSSPEGGQLGEESGEVAAWRHPMGVKTLRVGMVEDVTASPEQFFSASERMAVIPIPSSRPPTSTVIADGWLHGRGSSDSKAGAAIFAHVLARLKSASSHWAGSVVLLLDVDEHTGAFGGASSAPGVARR